MPWHETTDVMRKKTSARLIVSVQPRGVLDSPSCIPMPLSPRTSSETQQPSSPQMLCPPSPFPGDGEDNSSVRWSVEDWTQSCTAPSLGDGGLLGEIIFRPIIYAGIYLTRQTLMQTTVHCGTTRPAAQLCALFLFCAGPLCQRGLSWQGSLYDLIRICCLSS